MPVAFIGDMLIDVRWTHIGHDDEEWHDSFCLYAYVHPFARRILYLGKADYATVRKRLIGHWKEGKIADIQEDHRINAMRVFHGELEFEPGFNRSGKVLADVETLLIHRIQPPNNISAKRSRISRPGMKVFCSGEWPYPKTQFWDM